MRRIVCLILSVLFLGSACHRSSTPAHRASAAVTQQLQSLVPWIDTDADVLLFVHLPALTQSNTAAPWLTLLRQGTYGFGIGLDNLVTVTNVKFAAFCATFTAPPATPRRYFLAQTTTDPNTVLEQIADTAKTTGVPMQTTTGTDGVRLIDPTGELAIGRLNEQVIIGGNGEGLEHARQRAVSHWNEHDVDTAITPMTLASTPPERVLAWGRVRMTPVVRQMFPVSWRTITEIQFLLEDTDPLTLHTAVHFQEAQHTTEFAAQLKGVMTLGGINIHDTPWLTPLLGSTIVRSEPTTLQITMSLRPEFAMQIPTSGCHLAPHLHWHSGDVGLLGIVILLAAIWLWRRQRCE